MKTHLLLFGSIAFVTQLACGSDTRLQAIDGPEDDGTGGGATSTTSSSGGSSGGNGDGGTGATDVVGPTLVVIHEGGMTTYLEVADNGPLLTQTSYTLPSGLPRATTQLGPHLVVALDAAISEVAFRQFDHFVNQAGPGGFTDHTLQLAPIGSSTQLAGPLDSDDQGGLWMLSSGAALGGGPPSNALHWSPTGSVGGPWSLYESTPAIASWAVLPGARSLVASTGDGLVQIELRRGNKTMALFADFPGEATYPALQVYGKSLYGVTADCSGCGGAGQLHIWRDLEPGEPTEPPPTLGAPAVVIPLPEDVAEACSLTVGAEALVVGACRTDAQVPHDPMLYAFADPEALTSSSPADTELVLPNEPIELTSHHRPATTGASFSVYVRTETPLGLIYDNRDGSLTLTPDRFAADFNAPMVVPTDIALVD